MSEHGRIDPDANLSDADIERGLRIWAALGQRVGSFHVYDGSNGFQKWILGIVAAIAVLGVGGVIGMYGRLAAVETSLSDLKHQVEILETLIRSHPP